MSSEGLIETEFAKKPRESLLNKSFSNVGINRYRWWFLIICNLGQFSYFWVMSLLSSLQIQLEEELGLNASQYGLLQTFGLLGSWVMPLVMGYLIDLLGGRFGFIYGNLVVTTGLGVLALGGTYKSYPVMLAGQFIISFGMDAQNLSRYKLTCKWFRSKNLGFALAVGASLQSIGGVAGGYITPTLFNISNDVGFPLFVAFLIGAFSYVCAHISCEMDYRRENELKALVHSDEVSEKIKLQDLKKFKPLFWLFSSPFIIGQAAMVPLGFYNSAYLQKRFGFDNDIAGLFGQFQILAIVILSPILGYLMDRIGRIGEQMTFAAIIAILSCMLMGLLPNCDQCYTPLIPIILQGVFGGITGLGIMVGLTRLLDTNMLAIAFGVACWVMEIIQVFFPYLDGAIIDGTAGTQQGYFWVFIINGFINILAVIAGFAAIILDRLQGKKLASPLKPETKEDIDRVIQEHNPDQKKPRPSENI